MKNKTTIFVLTCMFLSFVLSCTSGKNRFMGKVAKTDQIHVLESGSHSGVWETRGLAIHFSYTSSRPDHVNLNGDIDISDSILNTFLVLLKLVVQVSFLDINGKVLGTSYVQPMYAMHSMPPEKIKFNSDLTLPEGTVAFCFSYSGKFRGDDRDMGILRIDHHPFH